MNSSVLLGIYSRRDSWAKRTPVPQYCFCCGATSGVPFSFTLFRRAKRSPREHSAQEAGLESARGEDLWGVAI